MDIIIGSARINEHGRVSGGAAGDQNGKEVCTQSYYDSSLGWVCLRPNVQGLGEKIANSMKDACFNNNIGYAQDNRNDVIIQLKKYGSIKNIKTKTEADCSSLVRACIMDAAGIDVGNFNTANEKNKLIVSGIFYEVKFKSKDELRLGDILVTKTKGHTVIVTDAPKNTSIINTRPIYSAKVKAFTLHVRNGAGKNNKHLRYIHMGDLLSIYEEKNGWGRINSNKNEWVSLSWVKKI